MAAVPVFVAVFVAGAVVEVADIGIVADGIIELYHGVFGLHYVQLGEMGADLFVAALFDILGESNRADKGAGVGEVAFGVDTAHSHEFIEPCAVIIAVYAGDADAVGVRAALEQRFPVEQRAVVKNDGLDIAVVLKSQAALREPGEIFKAERGDGGREFCRGDRRSLGEIDALYDTWQISDNMVVCIGSSWIAGPDAAE